MISYPEQVKVYRDLIPIGPLSVAELVEKLRSRLDIEEIGEKDITAGQMNAARFNAFHCVYNQKAIWKPEEMSFVLYKIVQNEKSRAYYDEPDLSWGIDGFIHVLFEEKTGFYASNSQRLNIEIGLARGVSKESIETEDYSFRGILAHLAIAEWEGRKIDPFVSDRSGRLKMTGQDRRNEGVMISYPEQVKAYRDLIPIGPLSVAELVEKLRSRLDIEEIGEKDITAGQMNAARFNAFHCVYNQKAIWKPEEMSFVLYKIVQNEKSRAYYDEPDLSWGIDRFIHVLFEEKTGFYASNSQRLSIEIGLARGVSKESIETEDYSFKGILAHLAIAESEGRKIDPL